MSVGEHYVLSAVNIKSSSLVLNGIVSSRYSDGASVMQIGPDGSVDATFGAIFAQNPVQSFECLNIAAALGAIGIAGLNISEVANSTELHFAGVTSGGTRAGTGIKVAMLSGMLIPTQLSARQGAEARLGIDVHARWDGTNAPFTFASGQALPTIAALTTVWTVGPVYINGTQLAGVQSITVDFGLTLFKAHGDGDVYPSFMAIQTRRPRITIQATKASAIATFGLSGAAQGVTDSLIYFRAKTDNGTNVADATASHVKIAIDDGLIRAQGLAASDPAAAALVDVIIEPKWDGTNAVMVITTGSAIA